MNSELAADGRKLVDGWGERRLAAGLRERTVAVRVVDLPNNASSPADQRCYRWMVKERHRIFVPEYESASIAYQNISRS